LPTTAPFPTHHGDSAREAGDAGYRLATYAPLVGSRFCLDHPVAGQVPVELTAATELRGPECFSLAFRAPVTPRLEQRAYILAHPALGEVMLFLVPVGRSDAHQELEAIVNRIPEGAASGG